MLPSVPVVKMLPAIMLPVTLNALPAYVFDVTVFDVTVFDVTVFDVTVFDVTVFAKTLSAEILPFAVITLPVLLKTTTFEVPPTLTDIFALAEEILTLLLPLVIMFARPPPLDIPVK